MTPEQEKRIEEIVLYANNLPPHKSRQKDYFKFLLGCLDELKEASCDDQEKIDHLAHNVLAIQDENAELKAELERVKVDPQERPLFLQEIRDLKAENTRLAAEIQDWKESMEHAKDEKSGHDEQHCTCVGLLRKDIKTLTKERDEFKYLKEKFEEDSHYKQKLLFALEARVKTLMKVISESIGWLRNVENSNSRYVSFGAEGIRLQFEAALASKEGG